MTTMVGLTFAVPGMTSTRTPVLTQRTKLLGVEAVRGLAALMVVLFHAGRLLSGPKDYGSLPFGGAFDFGRAGVDVFFVLSGFIITLIHAGDLDAPKGQRGRRVASFTRKRLLRIYPSYWICTLILLAIMFASPTPDRREHDAGVVLSSFLLLPTTGEPLLGPGWSLRHELLFYALFGLAIANRRLGFCVLAAWFAAIGVNMVAIMATGSSFAGGLVANWLLSPLNAEFLAGMGVTALLLRTPLRRPLALLGAGLILFTLSGWAETHWPDIPPNWPPLHLAYAAATFLILLGLVARERGAGLAVPAALVRLGDASYALYLLHVIVIMVGVFILRHLRPALPVPLGAAFPLLVAASIAAALLFTRHIERPLLKRLHRRGLSTASKS
jgi:peptidoglycan/LPS O-acetylase OafA/YrhL